MRLLPLLFCCGVVLAAANNPVKVDNDAVRILSVVDLPHHKGQLHKHAMNRVMIYLDDGNIELNYADGHRDEQHWKANQVAWSPQSGMHTSENVGTAPIRIIEIELKKPAATPGVIHRPAFDAVALDPQHNVMILDNEQVRVFRSWREPGATEPMHEHVGAGRAVVLLTDLHAKVRMPDGKSVDQEGKAGDLFWTGPITHAAKNVGTAKFEMIVVEVK